MHPCVCCGFLNAGELGSCDICEICFWEDDLVQLRYPDFGGGANGPSLIEAQNTFLEIGACETRILKHVRPPMFDEPREPGWRLIDLSIDNFEQTIGDSWPKDYAELYWWRPTFWRRSITRA